MRKIVLVSLLLTALFSAVRLSAQIASDVVLDCGYRMEITAIGTQVVGRLLPNATTNTVITSARWYNAETEELLFSGENINYDVSTYGEYKIKVAYQTISTTGILGCSNQYIKTLTLLEPACVQPFTLTDNLICGPEYAPVCGCNGITYTNECEAKQAGVATWWAGTCASQPSATECGTTDLGLQVLSGSPSQGYTVRFSNLADGNFTNIQLDFGDHTQMYQSSQWNTKDHHYQNGGFYNVTLSAWNVNLPGCVSSISKTFATDALSLEDKHLPEESQYVHPGDGNGDGKANVYDLLSIGKGYATSGVPRPDATIEWVPQYAPEWQFCTPGGTNYKHMDSNGDGVINEFDISPIEMHYAAIETTSSLPPVDDAPVVFVDFDKDTIVVDPASTAPIEISANLHIGTPEKPVLGLYAMACALRYPEFVEHDPSMLYDPSFFGSPNFVLTLGHDINTLQQYDFGVAHKNGNGANGYGRVAEINMRADYIIIIDIIDRAEAKIVPFIMPVEGIRAIDAAGNIKLLQPAVQDTLWIKLLSTPTSTRDIFESGKVRIFPNPATDQLLIEANSLKIEAITIVNAMGQVVASEQKNAHLINTIQVSDLPAGIYSVRIISDQGIGEQKIMVK